MVHVLITSMEVTCRKKDMDVHVICSEKDSYTNDSTFLQAMEMLWSFMSQTSEAGRGVSREKKLVI